jgi:hypothetical protein
MLVAVVGAYVVEVALALAVVVEEVQGLLEQVMRALMVLPILVAALARVLVMELPLLVKVDQVLLLFDMRIHIPLQHLLQVHLQLQPRAAIVCINGLALEQ